MGARNVLVSSLVSLVIAGLFESFLLLTISGYGPLALMLMLE
jgi:hypothetical protein